MCAEGRGRSAEASPSRKGLWKLMRVRRHPCVVFEALSRKQMPKFSQKTFAEAAVEGGNKKDYKRYSRKDRGRGSFWNEIIHKNKNHRSFLSNANSFCTSCYCAFQKNTYVYIYIYFQVTIQDSPAHWYVGPLARDPATLFLDFSQTSRNSQTFPTVHPVDSARPPQAPPPKTLEPPRPSDPPTLQPPVHLT